VRGEVVSDVRVFVEGDAEICDLVVCSGSRTESVEMREKQTRLAMKRMSSSSRALDTLYSASVRGGE
jgi:hypothetical protein